MRLRDGEALILFDGEGDEVEARLSVRGKAGFAVLGERRRVNRESPLQVVLVQALAASDKMDWVIQKAVELGVSAIQPVQAERSVLRLSAERAEKRLAHWRQVAVAACEQSGRTIPEVRAAGLGRTGWRRIEMAAAMCWRRVVRWANQTRDRDCPASSDVLVIPRAADRSRAGSVRWRNCRKVTLGPRVAHRDRGLVALAVLQARCSDF